MASEYLKRLAQRSRERREEDENVVRSVTRVSKKSAPKPTAPAPSITRQYQTIQSENERKLTGRERENNRLYSAYESEIKGELSRAAVRNPLVASEIIRADERQRKESAQRMGETAAVTSYLRSEQSKIPYTQVSDAGKLVKTGDTVKVIKPGEENLHQGDAPALGGPMESGSETAGKRYAESIRPFFENEDYLSDGDLLFEKYGEDAIPLIENALADWKENKRLHPERVQAGAEITEQADNFERQLRRTLAALREIRYTANRGNEDFSKLAAQGAQMDSPAATARERLTSDNKFTAGVGLMLGDHRYAAMTEEERQLYNYLLAKEGEQSAQEYLNTIEDRLNARFGKAFHDTAEKLENPLQRAGITAVTSVGAGVHDFGTGVHQSFTDEPVARAPLQYAADLYSSELGGVSKFAFDTGRTIGNMAPALAASAALGGLGVPAAAAGAVSSAMTGLSSAGNSYREAIEQGYLPEEARQYATMSGLSEFGTTYLLSGISKFGGKLTGNAAKAASERVINGALRFALDTGIKMGGEGIEEVLQNELDLFFRNMVLGEDNDLNPLTEENAYTFLMAAATAGLLEGPSSAVNAWNSSQLTQAGRAVEESGNLNTLLNRSLAGSPELRDAAGRVLYGEGTERLMAAGELLLRYAEETGDAGLILRTPERNEELSLPRQEAVFRDESQQKYGTKTGEHFRMLPVFKNGKVVEGYWDAVDGTEKVGYNKATGGMQDGAGLQEHDRGAGEGDSPAGVSGVQAERRDTGEGRPFSRGTSVGSGQPLSAELREKLTGYGVPDLGLKDSSGDRETFVAALNEARESDADHGWAVSPQTEESLTEEGTRPFLSEDGMAGIGVKADGDITAVFKNQKSKAKLVTRDLIATALVNGGTKLDCYGDGLVDLYSRYGFVPVARVKFNPEFANEGWTPDRGTPDIYFMMHNGDSVDTVAQNYGKYKAWTLAELDALPEMDYDEAYAYRDGLLEQRNAGAKEQRLGDPADEPPAQSNTRGSGETPAAFSSARNMEDSTGAFGEDSVGAERPLSTEEKAQLYDNYVREHGAIPKGENPVRDVDVPRKTGKNRHTRQGARTFIESAHTPEAMVQELKAAVADDLFAYERSGNKEMQNQADATLHNEGFDGALEKWDAVYERGIAKPGELVLGETLYIEAARRGEKQLAIELAAEVSELATEAGRSVQVMRIMSKATPEGKLYSLENSVRKINGRLKERYKKKFKRGKMKEVSISDELKEKLLGAETREEADAAVDLIERNIAEQLPSTIGDRVDAWRYFAMLSNPRTHIRNFLGNVVFGRVVDAKDLVGAALEKAFLPQDERSKAVLTPKDKALRDFATKDFETVRGEIMGTGKMNPQGRIEAQKKTFKHETLNRITGAPGNLLEWADEKALRPRYAKALAGFLKARGITAETIHTEKGKKALAAGRQYAITEAKKATFRDASRVANALSRWEKKNAFARVLIGGTIPFKKTPVNVLKRGVEYSPAGLIKGTADLLTKVKEGRMSASQAIDEISAGTVGTGLAILGYCLGSMGIVSLGGSDDEKERGFDALRGKQNYALNIGGHSYTIDWLSPAAMPFFVGAEFQKLLEEGSDLASKDGIEAVSKILDPVLEMSFMGGVQDSLESAAYGEYGGALTNLVVSPFVNYPSQFIPSVLGGVARTVDPVRRSYYADKNNNVFTNSMQKSFQKAVAKIPYFSQTLEPYVDQWGREEVNDSVFGRLLENFVSPGYYSKETVTEVDEEIERLYAQTGEKTVLPAYAPDDVTQDNKKYNMTAKEHTQYAKTKGQTAFRTIEALLDTPDYKEADDAEKVKFIRDVYDYSGQVAKKELLAGRKVVFEPDRWVSEAHAKAGNRKGGRQVAQAIAFRRTLAEVDLTVESYDKVRTAQRKMGISYQDYVDVYADVAAARKKYEDSDEKPDKIREAIYGSTKLNADQKAYMSFLFVRGDVEDADALKTLGGISYSVYEDYLNEASKITAKDENGNTVNGLAKRRKERYIDSLPINDSQKELLKATISTSKASKAYLKYRIEVAPLTREQKSELWEHFLGD